MLSYHGKSIARALLELFPNIGLDKTKFVQRKSLLVHLSPFLLFSSSSLSLSSSFYLKLLICSSLHLGPWSDSNKRRKFFEDFAKSHGFSPLNPHTWYTISRNRILAQKV